MSPHSNQSAASSSPLMSSPDDVKKRSGHLEGATTHHRRPWMRNPYFWGAVAGIVGIPLIRPLLRRVPEPPPILARLPAFQLTNQDNQAFGSEDLRGHVYVVGFFFTRCPSICPKLTRAMRTLQDRYIQANLPIRLISISIDPATDRPEILKRYARRFGAVTPRWTFLTGKESTVRHLVEKGFKQHLGRPTNRDGVIDIEHSGGLALVDQDGNLRGVYRTDKLGLDEIYHRSNHVRLADRQSKPRTSATAGEK